MATWSELRRLVRSRTGDPNGVFADDRDLVSYFNLAQEDACRQRVYRTSGTITLSAGTARYDVPTGLLDPHRVEWGGSNIPLESISHQVMNARSASWKATNGTPTAYIPDLETDVIWFYRNPDATAVATSATITVYGAFFPTTGLTESAMNDDSTTPLIPAKYHTDLCDSVVGMILTQDGRSKEQQANGERALLAFSNSLNTMANDVAAQIQSSKMFTFLHGRRHRAYSPGGYGGTSW